MMLSSYRGWKCCYSHESQAVTWFSWGSMVGNGQLFVIQCGYTVEPLSERGQTSGQSRISLYIAWLFCRLLIYTGQLELGDSHRPTAVRTCIFTACSQNLTECLKELGFVWVVRIDCCHMTTGLVCTGLQLKWYWKGIYSKRVKWKSLSSRCIWYVENINSLWNYLNNALRQSCCFNITFIS